MRGRALVVAALPTAVVALFLVTIFLTLQSLVLTPAMTVQRDIGRSWASIGFGTTDVPPAQAGVIGDIERDLEHSGISGVYGVLTTLGARLDGRSVLVREGPWSEEPFPERYILTDGRWPEKPSEVVVAIPNHAGSASQVGEDLGLFSGRMNLRVVGIANDRYGDEGRGTLLTGAGTWAQVDRTVSQAFVDVLTYPVIYWDGTRLRHVQRVLADHLESLDSGASSLEVRTRVSESLVWAPNLIADAPDAWTEENPTAYALPSIALPMLATLAGLGGCLRHLRRRTQQLTSLGLPRTRALTAGMGAFTAYQVLALAAAVGLGTLFALGIRYVMGPLHDQPLSPLVLPSDPLVRALLGVLAGLLLGAVVLARQTRSAQPFPTRERTKGSARRWRISPTDVRHVLAAASFGGAIMTLPTIVAPTQAMLFAGFVTAGCMLLAPEQLGLALRLLGEDRPTPRITRRYLSLERIRSSAAVAMLTAVFAAGTGYVSLVSTMVATLDDRQRPDVLSGQVLIADRGTPVVPPPTGTLQLARGSNALEAAREVPLYYSLSGSPDDPDTVQALLDGAFVMAVESIRDAELLLGRPLPKAQRALLGDGGMIEWSEGLAKGQAAPSDATLTFTNGSPTVMLESIETSFPRASWRSGKKGLMLRAEALKAGLPLSPGAVMFAPVTDAAAARLVREVEQAGLDPRVVQAYREPPRPIPPVPLAATAIGLAILSVMMTLAESGSRIRNMRPLLAQLDSIGIPPGWVIRAIATQQGIIVGLGAVVGTTVGLSTLVVSTFLMAGDWRLSVPGEQIVAILAVNLLAVAATTWLNTRNIADKTWG
jgi:hypothetical protein